MGVMSVTAAFPDDIELLVIMVLRSRACSFVLVTPPLPRPGQGLPKIQPLQYSCPRHLVDQLIGSSHILFSLRRTYVQVAPTVAGLQANSLVALNSHCYVCSIHQLSSRRPEMMPRFQHAEHMSGLISARPWAAMLFCC